MPPDVLIIADDLTGALDSSVAFAGPGRSVLVARNPDAIPALLHQSPDVLAVNTASRECDAEEAAQCVAAALAHLPMSEVPIIMKKVDSRLKGNIAAEMGALQATLGTRRIIAAPAIPSMGRRVTGGMLSGDGIAAPIDVASRIGVPAEIPDTESNRDMDDLVRSAGSGGLWVGARGLAFALARAAGRPGPRPFRLPPPLMIINGSRDPITVAQVDRLRALTSVLEAPDGGVPAIAETQLPLAVSICDGGGGLSGEAAGARFCDGVSRLLQALRPRSLLVAGGESCNGILDRLDIRSLQVAAELRPGLPVSHAAAPWGNLQLVTKSGGFGTPSLLAEIFVEAESGDDEEDMR
ncbi:four-carbon acid sugar kinase family protein [Martelella mediterranea]|uniref:four-carbon acid sugar kinase family protein n=1 Tax=Martelella mediterranea TaxID=293089 RepID=UPI001E3A650E|nr:four-carbon acid sugar kinase family protein [Martelella mediterranea]MCD1635381.1 four-carbon acid sugar kinase family protein [Martelella mediterranea]